MKGYEIFGVAIWLVLMPILGIVGYFYDISWLLYVFGGIIALTEVIFLFTGALRCFGSILLIVSCAIGYSITKSFWIGLLLGSCITAAFLSVGLVVVLCFSGMSTITSFLKRDKTNDNW